MNTGSFPLLNELNDKQVNLAKIHCITAINVAHLLAWFDQQLYKNCPTPILVGYYLPQGRLVLRHEVEWATTSETKNKMDPAAGFDPVVTGVIGGGILLVTRTLIVSITLCMFYCKVDPSVKYQRAKPGRSMSSSSSDGKQHATFSSP